MIRSTLTLFVVLYEKSTEKLKPLKKAQNNKFAKCCMLGVIEPVHGQYWQVHTP